MTVYYCVVAWLLAMLSLSPVVFANSFESPTMPEIMNDLAIGVYAETTHLMIFNTFGGSEEVLSYSGTFSATGWTVTTTGIYLGLPVDISAVGTFDTGLNTGSLTATGTVGAATWDALGSWAFTIVDSLTLDLEWLIEATVETIPISKPDVVVDKRYKFRNVPPLLLYDDTGTETPSEDGQLGQPLAETSFGFYNRDTGRSKHTTISGKVREESENTFPPGSKIGTTRVVPAPNSLAFLSTGTILYVLLFSRGIVRHYVPRLIGSGGAHESQQVSIR
jgi:hypothetical protein